MADKLSIFALAVAALLFSIIVGTLMGAISGFIVGLFFSMPILLTLDAFGLDITNLALWQVGATLGFVGPFFRPVISKG